MLVQMIELDEVSMAWMSDEALEASSVAVGGWYTLLGGGCGG